MESAQISIAKFDPATIRPNSRIMVLGRRAAGKTTLIGDLSNHVDSHSVFDLSEIQKNPVYNGPLSSTVFFEASYMFDAKPALRRILDYVFIFKTNHVQTRQQLYHEFGTCSPTYEGFCGVLDSCTANPYECLVIDLQTGGMYWYAAASAGTANV